MLPTPTPKFVKVLIFDELALQVCNHQKRACGLTFMNMFALEKGMVSLLNVRMTYNPLNFLYNQ